MTESITISGREFRLPWRDLIRHLTGHERQGLRESIAAKGIEVPVIVDQDDNVLDGANRLSIASDLGTPLDKVPIRVREVTSREESVQIVHTLNCHRRQLTPEDMKAAKQRRDQLIKELKADGKTQREIAEAVGTSKTTVQRLGDVNSEVGPRGPTSELTLPQRQEKVAAMIQEGKSQTVIAEEIGVTQRTISNDVQTLTEAGKLTPPEKSTGKDGKARKAKAPSKPKGKKTGTQRNREKVAAIQKEKRKRHEAEARARFRKEIASAPDPDAKKREVAALLVAFREVATVIRGHTEHRLLRNLLAQVAKQSLKWCGERLPETSA